MATRFDIEAMIRGMQEEIMKKQIASDPMTLAEFETEALELTRDAREHEYDIAGTINLLRPLVLRLLARERARCIDAIRDETRDAVNAGTTPQFVRVPQTAGDIARDTLASIGATATEVHPHSDIGILVAGLRRIAEMEPQS